jgi:hypothetical protein
MPAPATVANKKLTRLLESDPHYAQHFRFSLLQALPSTTAHPKTIHYENLYKEKLGCCPQGLNKN